MARQNSKDHGDLGASQVQERMDEITAKGFRGDKIDETPNSAYTVAGVTAGASTPETVDPGSEGSTKGDPDALVGGTGQPVERGDAGA